MNGNFKVGEVLVGQNFVRETFRNGQECVVTKGLHPSFSHDSFTKVSRPRGRPVYQVRWSDGSITVQEPFKLRRKQPPSGELSILNMFVVAPPQRTKEIA